MLSPFDRRSESNGIWLCTGCATKIDRDQTAYPTTLIRKWKSQAEELANFEIGKSPPAANDAVDTLVAAMTGNPSLNLPAKAIPNVHEAVRLMLEPMDPRFSIKTSHVNDRSMVEILAREKVELKMSIDLSSDASITHRLEGLRNHGTEIRLPATSIAIAGSPLIEYVQQMTKGGTISLGPRARAARRRVWLVNPNSQEEWMFDYFVGNVTGGTHSVAFQGSACDGIFTMSDRFTIGESSSKTDLTVNFLGWQGCDIRSLPHFNALSGLFERLNSGWQLNMSCEIEGRKYATASLNPEQTRDFSINVNTLLGYTRTAASLCRVLELAVRFNAEVTVSRTQYSAIANAEKIALGKGSFSSSEVTKNPSITCETDKAGYELLTSELKKSRELQIANHRHEKITVFDESVSLPQQTMHFVGVDVQVVSTTDLPAGKLSVLLELKRLEDFRLEAKFEMQ